ncbi:cytochrome b/b6 domain-containing protein [Enterovibrio makurazakiensis]|uniref:Cytochrome b/b6 domain-containing protein n=1 Tax=Enterovibrio gelatinilyticus TaxID=2899819 RepID=A0ABT5R4E6_9GAMM|nr:cytochrome b/b6 domain-containing protein [Enterovibrio sp. ZSDZ42]MDD1795136.1 cytochrome b/b6 domain-containing protein [Enterovibrio sp. ZSDZ42]
MKVWDLSTRLYHWAQALLFMVLMFSGFSGNGPHVQLGLAIMTLIIWRMAWGFVGSETSRFKQFLHSPKHVFNYLRGREKSQPGHNPSGGWMVISLVLALFLQCISGLALAGFFDALPHADVLLTDTVFYWLEMVHLQLAYILPALVFVHVGAILIYKFRSKPLTWAMVTGKQKPLSSAQAVIFVSQWRALLVLGLATSVTMGIVALA